MVPRGKHAEKKFNKIQSKYARAAEVVRRAKLAFDVVNTPIQAATPLWNKAANYKNAKELFAMFPPI